MPGKNFVNLLGENLRILERVAMRLRPDSSELGGIPRKQIEVLIRLYLGGAARLKDIADREFTPTPNLCATFRKLERDGLIQRTPDEEDRRNVWYSVTDRGAQIAQHVMAVFNATIERAFAKLDKDDRYRMTDALATINEILKKSEDK